MDNTLFIRQGQFTATELPLAAKIQQRRLQILVHSKIYYHHNTNIISDQDFDRWSQELVTLQNNNPKIADRICYADAFKGWEGGTGAYLPLYDEWVIYKAEQILQYHKGGSNFEGYEKIQQGTGKQSSEKPKRKKSTKQRGNPLF